MNSVTLIGRLTRDPDVRYSAGTNMAVCRFSVAINTGYGDNKRTDYPSIVVFGKQAENCERFLHKGSQVAITGRLQTGSYEKNGATVYTTDVVANNVEFLDRVEKGQGQETGYSAAPTQDRAPEGFSAIEEDIPF